MVYPVELSHILGDTADLTSLRLEDAMDDRIELWIDGIRLLGGDADELHASAFLRALRLCDVPSDLSEGRRPNSSTNESAFFNKPQGISPSRRCMRVRKQSHGFFIPKGQPIFGGVIEVRRVQRAAVQRSVAVSNISLKLSLNPTRFLHHNYHRRYDAGVRGAQQPQIIPELLLSKRMVRLSAHQERTLDGNDNCILSHRALRYVQHESFPPVRAHAIDSILTFLIDRVRRAASRIGARLEVMPTYNLRKVETYWERACDDPNAFVRLAFTALSKRSRVWSHDFQPRTSSSDQVHGLLVTAEMAKGIILKVYAKTNQRVRFEIVTDCTKATIENMSSHTSEDVSVMAELLDKVAQNAHRHVSAGCRYLQNVPQSVANYTSLIGFLDALYEIVPDASERHSLLSALVNVGSYRTGRSDPFHSKINRLRQRGYLVRSQRGVVCLADEYLPFREFLLGRTVNA